MLKSLTNHSNAHWFSRRTSSSSSGVKSFLMLKVFLVGPLFGVRSLDVLLAVLDDLRKDLAGDVGERDAAVGAIVLDHVLDRLRFQRHRLVHLERLSVRALEGDLPRRRHDWNDIRD
ncbi:hypothetical protein Ahy_Scaffold1g107150 [Arachis hypogaea]|uniref:Uncharacterized protein n=1 Tax=Arachis hypogaea TaxID=3818 RepID=A0A444WUQ5_ARAHY|nr:hypothetical protein Ahy_Scaffold1g107150 [Arachis hypogaea]